MVSYVQQGKFAEGESLLLECQRAYTQRAEPGTSSYYVAQLKQTCRHLVQLYQKSSQPDKAAEWEAKLNALTERTQADPEINQ